MQDSRLLHNLHTYLLTAHVSSDCALVPCPTLVPSDCAFQVHEESVYVHVTPLFPRSCPSKLTEDIFANVCAHLIETDQTPVFEKTVHKQQTCTCVPFFVLVLEANKGGCEYNTVTFLRISFVVKILLLFFWTP